MAVQYTPYLQKKKAEKAASESALQPVQADKLPTDVVRVTPTSQSTNITGGYSTEEMQNRRNQAFLDSQRQASLTPTPDAPVKTIGAAQQSKGTSLEDVFVKQSTGQPLTSDDYRALFQNLQNQNTYTLQNTGLQTAIDESKRIAAEQQKYADEQTKKAQETYKTQLDKDLADIADRSFREQRQVAESAKQQAESTQGVYSFSGFGRSTSAANTQAKISSDMGRAMESIQRARSLEEQAAIARSEEGMAEKAAALMKGAQEARSLAAKIESESIQEVAKLNAEQANNFADSYENLLKLMPQSQKSKASEYVSSLTGVLSDEYGNPIYDPSGKTISVAGAPSKYSSYTDDYTGQTFFYDPYDPTKVIAAPGNSIQTYPVDRTAQSSGFDGIYQEGATPQVSSTPTTDYSNMNDVTEVIKPELQQFAKNCVFFARNFVPNIPDNAKTVSGRKEGIKRAESNGYGGFDLSQVQEGDAIHTSEGSVGHTAIVKRRDGDILTLLEANYKDGRITDGRKININDPKLLGWIRPDKKGGIVTGSIEEGTSLPIQEQISGVQFTPDAVTQFKKFAESGSLPTFSGSSQAQKDAKEASFRAAYNVWAATNPQAAQPKYDLQQVNQLASRYKQMSQEFRELNTGFSSIQNYDVNHQNPWADQSLIFSFMKVLDPTSVVREGEYNTAVNNQGLLESILGTYWRQAINAEGVLKPESRQKIINEMNRLYNQRKGIYDSMFKSAVNVGKQFNIPANLYLDYVPGESSLDGATASSPFNLPNDTEINTMTEAKIDSLLKRLPN